ncbi:hypothetical protein GCM10023063_25570 [Arthrobacter methylotrophus]|uniref:Uncharacterized protein n=1 Tax=Arthrobacter methylotrophus TaxID=121291 RepID=A0ABV5UPT9_9MICC
MSWWRMEATPANSRACLVKALSLGGPQLAVSLAAPLLIASSTAGGRLRVRQARGLGIHQGLLLDEDALSLVTRSGPAEAHYYGRQAAGLARPARQSGITGGQVSEVVEIGARHAQRRFVFH